MITTTLPRERSRLLFRHSAWDGLMVTLALLHGVVLLLVPVAPVIALGVWWNSNTISHYFIHNPYFRSRTLNALFSIYLSGLLGIPQSIWRARHLAHHAGVPCRLRLSGLLVVEVLVVLGLWSALLVWQPWFFLTAYLPGYLAGLALCGLHGYYEHLRGGTISHYGAAYNLLFFNDGYHVEHHARPGTHWTRLPESVEPKAATSRWPAVLRWLEVFSLESLERWALRSRAVQRFLLRSHERAFRALLPHLPEVRHVGIVGGGLFPRTLLVLQRLLPEARFVVIDRCAANIATAQALLPEKVQFVNDSYDPAKVKDLDLVVIPLSLIGDRQATYREPQSFPVIVHEWIWRPRGVTAVVSVFLLKRLNLVKPCAP